ncbi:MAG: hypothetical protein JXM71_10720 [Spirochaetales bacterium]|nr:hypothetical protein [Spirochaetales bacterium]
MTTDDEMLIRIIRTLVIEVYDGPENPRMTWVVDNEPSCGILGTLRSIDAVTASRPFAADDGATAATHAGHVLFALNLANQALRGENAHENAVWKDSWKLARVDEAAWRALLDEIDTAVRSVLEAISRGAMFSDEWNLTGLLGQISHGAWHLGAIRQGLGLIHTPAPR